MKTLYLLSYTPLPGEYVVSKLFLSIKSPVAKLQKVPNKRETWPALLRPKSTGATA